MLSMQLGGKRVLVAEHVVSILTQYRQTGPRDPEAGGILLGQLSVAEDVVLINRASVPGPFDRATRHSFRRDSRWAQGISTYEFLNSGGHIVYLGEWHTHPARAASPSPRDTRMIAEQYAGNLLVTDFLLLFIVANEELYVGLYDGTTLRHVTCPLDGSA